LSNSIQALIDAGQLLVRGRLEAMETTGRLAGRTARENIFLLCPKCRREFAISVTTFRPSAPALVTDWRWGSIEDQAAFRRTLRLAGLRLRFHPERDRKRRRKMALLDDVRLEPGPRTLFEEPFCRFL
jgi:hypothetical protein